MIADEKSNLRKSASSADIKLRICPSRRGVLLLVVLGLLTIFTLLCITFVLVARQSAVGSRAASRAEQHEDPPEVLLNAALLQVIRGTTNRRSVIGPHSLLEDIYGSDEILGRATSDAAEFDSGGQFVEFTIQGFTDLGLETTINDYYNGRVLTMLSGPAAGHSTRITGYTAATNQLRVLAFENGQFPDAQDRFIINGRPFNGTGFGYEPNRFAVNRLLDAMVPLDLQDPLSADGEIALMPNPVFLRKRDGAGNLVVVDPTEPEPANPGGADEDYDIPDFQNMLLAMQVSKGPDPLAPLAPPGDPVVPIPSLHRPAMINFWINDSRTGPALSFADLPADLRRKIMLRPVGKDVGTGADPVANPPDPPDHPDFDGSNPNYQFIYDPAPSDPYPWDVDNNGDGVPDSVWVDIGLPVQTASDGRQYKPLVAILCLDLDGRLNINAHGGPTDLAIDPTVDPIDLDVDPIDSFNGPYAGNGGNATLPRGLGFGTAEISLTPLLNQAEIRALTQGGADFINPALMLDGRYGELGVDLMGVAPKPRPGVTAQDDLLSQIKHFGTPTNYWNFTNPTEWGSPADLHGLAAVGLDLRGQPFYATVVNPQNQNHPYEFNLSARASRGAADVIPGDAYQIDNPFDVADLEPFLRRYDIDFEYLSSRLSSLLYDPLNKPRPMVNDADRRQLLTTDSWDLPVPNGALPLDVANVDNAESPIDFDPNDDEPVGNTTLADVLRATLLFENQLMPLLPDEIRQNIRLLLSPELAAGLRFDVNRPFGNGREDNGNFVVDDPGEASAAEMAWPGINAPNGNTFSVAFDHNNDGITGVGFNDMLARQQFARHLYVLMMLLSRKDASLSLEEQARFARHVAQWAVNVVDFRDRDSIMTGFEYDEEPFVNNDASPDGSTWDVDDILRTDDSDPATGGNPLIKRRLVWGCERPELLITETLAFHDRRATNTNEELGGDFYDPDPLMADNDYDQKHRPRGSLFVELYNPWSANDPAHPELHTAAFPRNSVQMDRASTGTEQNPVWRLAITEQPELPLDDPNNLTPPIERTVYFRNPGSIPDGQVKYYMNKTDIMDEIVLPPGHYAVIGPRPIDLVALLPTTDVGSGVNSKEIVLDAGVLSDPMDDQFDVRLGGAPEAAYTPGEHKPIIAIVLDRSDPVGPFVAPLTPAERALRMNVSEEAPFYVADPNYDATIDEYGGVDGTPFDKFRFTEDKTYENYRYVHLQRLANPLLPWNPGPGEPGHDLNKKVNPYITIDTMPIDVTVYHGIEADPSVPRPMGGMSFDSRQRGGTLLDRNRWSQKTRDPQSGSETDPLPDHTLGYLNEPFGGSIALEHWSMTNAPQLGGFVGPPLVQASDFYGDPTTAFPWLTWNNRPFASHYELMLVPEKAPWELLAFDSTIGPNGFEHFTLDGVGMPQRDRYDAVPLNAPINPSPFEHLLNFFESDDDLSGMPKEIAGQWHRVLDYVHVPSRFVGTETFLDPTTFSGPGPGLNPHPYHPPFNRVSRYRDPGRININTIFDQRVGQGLAAGLPELSTPVFAQKFTDSRRGFKLNLGTGQPHGPMNAGLILDNRYPTFFANPFRSSAGNDLVPIPKLKQVLPDTAADRLEVDVTLLRRDPDLDTDPLFALTMPEPYRNTSRNPYFRYQAFTKLGNSVTTRSNVYAIWVTVGYFEVTPGPVDPGHPDGFRLGRELGVDSGEIRRHRAFAIFDRTIPVAFERGKNHNVDKAILVKRIIE